MTTNLRGMIRKNDVWVVNFDPQVGEEIDKPRPAVVISITNAGRKRLKIVVPFTTTPPQMQEYPWKVSVPFDSKNGLDEDSWADASQIKSISIKRFAQKTGTINNTQMDEIAAAVALCIGYQPTLRP